MKKRMWTVMLILWFVIVPMIASNYLLPDRKVIFFIITVPLLVIPGFIIKKQIQSN